MRCFSAGPSAGRTLGSRPSTKPSAICVLCHVGESRVSPNTPTEPPFALTSDSPANDVSS